MYEQNICSTCFVGIYHDPRRGWTHGFDRLDLDHLPEPANQANFGEVVELESPEGSFGLNIALMILLAVLAWLFFAVLLASSIALGVHVYRWLV